MREEIENLLSRYQFEFNDEQTMGEIFNLIQNFLMSKVNTLELYDFKVTDRSSVETLHFEIIYQRTRMTNMMVMTINLWNQELKISNFEKNIIGSRDIKKLGF